MPNRAVDVNSWARSACYPQGSFCPLSDGPPTRDHRITKSCFRTCSDRRPHSQAPFYLCAQWPISIRISHPLITLPDLLPDEQNAYHLFPILVSDGKRDALHDYLEQNGVGTVCHYPIAPHKQECYREWNHMSLPITEQIAAQELSLPIGPTITMEEVAEVVNIVNQFL